MLVTNSRNYVAYCFAEKTGYSKFGKYMVMEMQMEHLFILVLNQIYYDKKI